MQPAAINPAIQNPPRFPGTGIYPLLDLDTCLRRGLDPAVLLQGWRAGDAVRYYQWRAKGLSAAEYLDRACELRRIAPGLPLFANDHAELLIAPCIGHATRSGSSLDVFAGLHLGQEDLAALSPEQLAGLAEIRRRRPEFVLGLSTHSADQIEAALAFEPVPGEQPAKGASKSDSGAGPSAPFWCYLALGPCFATVSKPTGRDPVLSREEFQRAIESLITGLRVTGPYPLVLIGGIQSTNIEELLLRLGRIDRHRRIRPVVAGIEWALGGTQISELAGKIQTYSS